MFYIYSDNRLIYQPMDDNYLVLQPKLSVEMGKAGSLQFQVPPTHPLYNQLDRLRTYTSVQLDETEIFRGRILSNERAFNNVRTVYCEGDLAYLVDSVQKGEKYSGKTHALFRKIIAAHNSRVEAAKRFTVGEINIEDRDIVLVGQSDEVNTGAIDYKQIAVDSIVDNWNNTFDYIQTCLIDYCGGYLRTRRVGGTTYIDLLTDFGVNASQDIELGVNMLDLKEEISAEDLFTVLIPLGDDNLTIASVNNGSDELVDAAAVAQYGRIVRTHVFQNVNNASTLLENGQRYLASNVNVPTTLKIKAVDMHLLNPDVTSIFLGDRVHLVSTAHNIVDYLTCTKIEYDLANPANTTYTFGNPKQTLTERYREDKRKQSDTYGNSSGGRGVSAAGAASSAAGAAAQISDDKTSKALNDFYKEWINIDPDSPDGKIDLGALYKEVKDGKTILQQQVGIDLDATTGNINLRSLKQSYDETARKTSENEASISLLQKDTESSITLLTSRQNDLKDAESKHYAEFQMFANDTESKISLKADTITLNENVRVVNRSIAGLSDRVGVLEADYAEIDNLIVNKLEAFREHVTSLNADNISVSNSLYYKGYRVVNSQHSHKITENADGTVTIGYATDKPQSFRIADTVAYSEGVSAAVNAVTIDSLTRRKNDEFNSTDHKIRIYARATASNGKTKDVNFVTDTTAYDIGYLDGSTAGASDVKITSLIRRKDDEFNTTSKAVTIYARATASNGKTYDINFVTNRTAYDAGYSDGSNSGSSNVSISSVVRRQDDVYFSSAHKTKLYLRATASNGVTADFDFLTDTAAYDAGYKAGYAQGKADYNGSGASGVYLSTLSASNPRVYTSFVYVDIYYKLSNGKDGTLTKSARR